MLWCHRDKGIVGYEAPEDETPTVAGSSTVPCEWFSFNFVRVNEMKNLTSTFDTIAESPVTRKGYRGSFGHTPRRFDKSVKVPG